jgi:dTMP kinase
VRELIEPALARGQVVVCDRFYDSTTVYQGIGRKLDPDKVAVINGFAVGACVPDLTLLIDIDPRIGLERARGRELFDRMESQSQEFYQRVRQGYLDLAKREPKRIKVIDGSQGIEAVERQIWEAVRHVL